MHKWVVYDPKAMVMFPRRNVLIFHLGALGDFVLTWPLAMALARIHPQSRIIYVTHGQKGKLAEKVLRIESTDVEGGWHHLFGSPADLPENSRKMLEGAHSIFSFIANQGDAWTENVKAIAPEAQLMAEIVEPKDYLELLFQLGLASAVVCNDTGPAHLAGIIGTPTIALFGPTDPQRWKPLGPHVQTIRGTTMESISVETVYDAVTKRE